MPNSLRPPAQASEIKWCYLQRTKPLITVNKHNMGKFIIQTHFLLLRNASYIGVCIQEHQPTHGRTSKEISLQSWPRNKDAGRLLHAGVCSTMHSSLGGIALDTWASAVAARLNRPPPARSEQIDHGTLYCAASMHSRETMVGIVNLFGSSSTPPDPAQVSHKLLSASHPQSASSMTIHTVTHSIAPQTPCLT